MAFPHRSRREWIGETGEAHLPAIIQFPQFPSHFLRSGDSSSRIAGSSSTTSTQPAGTGQTKVYVVKAGDTLSGIAARFGISVVEIEELNADADLTTLQPGQKLTVPAP